MPMPRRGFLLRVLSLAPASLLACSASGAAAARAGAGAPAPEAGPTPAPPPPATPSLERLRDFAIAAAAEPAFTFRASIVRTGDR